MSQESTTYGVLPEQCSGRYVRTSNGRCMGCGSYGVDAVADCPKCWKRVYFTTDGKPLALEAIYTAVRDASSVGRVLSAPHATACPGCGTGPLGYRLQCVAIEPCAHCGHDRLVHGAKGHGTCRVGRESLVEQMTAAVRAAVMRGKEFKSDDIDIARACRCKRYRRTKR